MTREEKQKAIDALKISAPVKAVTQEEFNDYIQILNKVMDWLEQEPYEDCVSREAVLSLKQVFHDNAGYETEYVDIEDIKTLPPVTPKQRTGKWIKSRDRYGNNHFTCPFCEYDIATKYDGAWGDNYCSDCGAKLEGESK